MIFGPPKPKTKSPNIVTPLFKTLLLKNLCLLKNKICVRDAQTLRPYICIYLTTSVQCTFYLTNQFACRLISVIDISHRRLDVGFKLLAQKSLEKWRRLDRMASVEELIATLRKMRRDNTAAKIRQATTPRTTARTN